MVRQRQMDMYRLRNRHTRNQFNQLNKLVMLQVKGVVSEQTKQWSDMVRQHQMDMYRLRKRHTRDQFNQLNKLVILQVKGVVSEQTKQWSDMVRQHQMDMYRLRKRHTRDQFNQLNKLLKAAQKDQLANFHAQVESRNKQMGVLQTKTSINSSKKLNQDENFKTKGEKERRLKELQEKNLKSFLDQRRREAQKSENMERMLIKDHKDQEEALKKEEVKALELQDQMHQEAILAAKPETVV